MHVRIDDTFLDSLTRLLNKEQKAVKTAVFDLIVDRRNPALRFKKLESGTWSARVNKDIRIIADWNEDDLTLRYVDRHDDAYQWAERHTLHIPSSNDADEQTETAKFVGEISSMNGKQTILFRLLSFAEMAVCACSASLDALRDAIQNVRDGQTYPLPTQKRKNLKGVAEVRELFRISKVDTAAGCYVIRGKIACTDRIRIIRGGMAIHEGKIDSLKRFKDNVGEVRRGSECGIGIWNYSNIKIGDRIESYKTGKAGFHDL